MRLLAILVVLGAVAFGSTACSSCDKATTFGGPAAESDFLGNPCGQKVYEGTHCLDLPQGVKDFFGKIHEDIFDCEPDPVIQSAPAPCVPVPAAKPPCRTSY